MSLPDGHAAAIRKIKEHALNHYEEDGWDYLVECWSDEEISCVISELGFSGIISDAEIGEVIAQIGSTLRILDSRRKDVQAEIF